MVHNVGSKKRHIQTGPIITLTADAGGMGLFSISFKENVGYIILADLCQIKIYSSFDHYAAIIILNLG